MSIDKHYKTTKKPANNAIPEGTVKVFCASNNPCECMKGIRVKICNSLFPCKDSYRAMTYKREYNKKK